MMDEQKDGTYCFLSWEIDTTGRRLIDEMCHIAAYSNIGKFKQYIMPYRDIDYTSRKRYLLKTVSIGFYRVLRETIGGKILKTKSEISALTDFLDWLEQRKLSNKKDIILMYYDSFTPAPYILIEALKKYDLLGRFQETVKGFANSYNFIKAKCENSMQTYSIKTLAKVLLNKEYDKPHDAFERAKIIYEIVAHLSVGESQDGELDFQTGLKDHLLTIEVIESAIAEMKITLKKQNSLKPIFGPIIRFDKKRRQAIILRRHLTKADIEYKTLKNVWTNKEDMTSFLKSNLQNEVSDEDIGELVIIITKHFGGNENDEQNVDKIKTNNNSTNKTNYKRYPKNRSNKFSGGTRNNNSLKTKTTNQNIDNNINTIVVDETIKTAEEEIIAAVQNIDIATAETTSNKVHEDGTVINTQT